ncbi:MAG: VOC family protein [Planctomycetes bacterium]|nr:VOC family protein [Planctomycetota bacterium]
MKVRRGEIGLFVSDVARATGFYMATLGFKRVPDEHFGASDGTWEKIAAGDLVLAIFKAKTAEPAPAPSSRSGMCADIIVDDLSSAVLRLTAAGAKVGEIREWPGGRVVEFSDLDGIGWALIEMKR